MQGISEQNKQNVNRKLRIEQVQIHRNQTAKITAFSLQSRFILDEARIQTVTFYENTKSSMSSGFKCAAILGLKLQSWADKLALDFMRSLASWTLALQWSKRVRKLFMWLSNVGWPCCSAVWLHNHTPISMPQFPQCVCLCGWVRTGYDIGAKWMERDFSCALSHWDETFCLMSYTCTVQTVSAKTNRYVIFTPQWKANVTVMNTAACHLCSRTQERW